MSNLQEVAEVLANDIFTDNPTTYQGYPIGNYSPKEIEKIAEHLKESGLHSGVQFHPKDSGYSITVTDVQRRKWIISEALFRAAIIEIKRSIKHNPRQTFHTCIMSAPLEMMGNFSQRFRRELLKDTGTQVHLWTRPIQNESHGSMWTHEINILVTPVEHRKSFRSRINVVIMTIVVVLFVFMVYILK